MLDVSAVSMIEIIHVLSRVRYSTRRFGRRRATLCARPVFTGKRS